MLAEAVLVKLKLAGVLTVVAALLHVDTLPLVLDVHVVPDPGVGAVPPVVGATEA